MADLELTRRQAMLQDAQRVVDHQVAAIEQLDNKTSQALTVAVSGFSLVVLLGALAPRASVEFLLLLVAAAAVNGLAVLRLLRAYHGMGADGDVSVGPSPAWIATALAERTSHHEYLEAVLLGYARYAQSNERFMAEMRDRRQVAIALLLLAALLYGAAALDLGIRIMFR